MKRILLTAAFLCIGPGHASGQMGELLQFLSGGGSWMNLDIVEGVGTFASPVVPVAGLAVDGCFQVWAGHSGEWLVEAQDAITEQSISESVAPGEPVRFEYAGALTAQLAVDVTWSEPRDTTLFIWVGIQARGNGGSPTAEKDICSPS